jgi:tyrosyl-tRNA synthetase
VSFKPVKEQLEYLKKGVVDLVREEELKERLERSIQTGRPLRIKVGFDPSAPDIHFGHTVLLRKMKHFQDMGHTVIFLIGDFTGLIGDPSGRSKTRPQLSREEILANAETYKKQAFKILHPDKTVIDFNSRWLGNLSSEGFVKLAAKYTVARMLERDDFAKRYSGGYPISIHEFLYPLAQGYDSVALKVDGELGGTDQLFNLLVGRDIMKEYGLEPQIVMTTPLLEGTDGVEKMSKSLGNYIGVEEPPKEIYGKVMSISDELMWKYYELLTDKTVQEIEQMKKEIKSKQLHPKNAKSELAKMLIEEMYSKKDAVMAEKEFEKIFVNKDLPDHIREVSQPCSEESLWLPKLMVAQDLAKSTGEARRLIKQGGVYLNGKRIDDENYELMASEPAEYILKVGKRRFLKILIR